MIGTVTISRVLSHLLAFAQRVLRSTRAVRVLDLFRVCIKHIVRDRNDHPVILILYLVLFMRQDDCRSFPAATPQAINCSSHAVTLVEYRTILCTTVVVRCVLLSLMVRDLANTGLTTIPERLFSDLTALKLL